MKIQTDRIAASTNGNSQVLDITNEVSELLTRSDLKEGNATVFVTGSTASVSTTEFEPGLQQDIPLTLERLIPAGTRYHHDDTWHDGNGHSHVRATFIGPSLTIPFSAGRLMLGTWQQIVLIDHDNRPRQREIVVQLIGQ